MTSGLCMVWTMVVSSSDTAFRMMEDVSDTGPKGRLSQRHRRRKQDDANHKRLDTRLPPVTRVSTCEGIGRVGAR